MISPEVENKDVVFVCKMRNVVKFLLPLALASLSSNIMFISDRIVLTHYSVDALLVSALAGSFTYIPLQFLMNIAGACVVFVGQLNGAKNFTSIGNLVWQIAYFSVFTSICYAIFAIFMDGFTTLPEAYKDKGLVYQKILMASSGMPAISVAFSSFIVGIGKSRLVIYVIAFANVLNILLDIILVFGRGIIPSMGLIGSAIATVIAQLIQLIIFFSIFYQKKYRSKFGISTYKLNLKLMHKCIALGMPLAISALLETSAWYVLLLILNNVSKQLATIESFSIGLVSFFTFFSNSILRASSAFNANAIGERNKEKSQKSIRLFLLLNFYVCCIFAIPLVVKQDLLFRIIDYINPEMRPLYGEISFVCICIWMGVLVDGIYSVIIGALQAGGDVRTPYLINICTLWGLLIFPIMFLSSINWLSSIKVVYAIITFRTFCNCIIIYIRYTKFKWFVSVFT